MKQLITILIVGLLSSGLSSQTLEELNNQKAEIEAAQSEVQSQVDAYQSEIDALNSRIEELSGWKKGLLGSIGLNFGGTNNWATSATPNTSSSSLVIGLNGFANKVTSDYFWRNKGCTRNFQGLFYTGKIRMV